jgi:TolB-like protein/class 3 adenylate cyclase/tetratricopeptide (TPR) repeat protein
VPATRKLAAILSADIVGYSQLMDVDAERTLTQLKSYRRSLVDDKLKEHRGRIVKTTGDGMLVEFASVVDAVRCAVEIQRDMGGGNAHLPPDKRIEFRIGISVGDIIISSSGDVFGHSVNVAARLESIAEPGGICVSGRVQEDVEGKLDVLFEDKGEQQLKNIAKPVRVYCVRLEGIEQRPMPGLVVADKPSIAVLPFQNLSEDPTQEYFADGMVDDIITALSRMTWLFVISRNSSFAYKGKAIDVNQISRELGVRYVLEGTVRKSTSGVRITGQLIDANTGGHLWAGRFEGNLKDVFGLQDQITESVVGQIAPKLERAEIERAKRKPTERLDAYDHFLRGMANFHQQTNETNSEALRLFNRAIELDPDFALPYGLGGICYSRRKARGWATNRAEELVEAERLARRAVELGRDDAVALYTAGFTIAHVVGDLDAGANLIDAALAIDPSSAAGWYYGGWVKIMQGEPEQAIAYEARSMRLSPMDPLHGLMRAATGFAHLSAGRYDEAVSWAQKACLEQPTFTVAWRLLASSSALSGRLDQARRAMAHVLELDPGFEMSTLSHYVTLRRPEDFARYAEGLRLAGLPEEGL